MCATARRPDRTTELDDLCDRADRRVRFSFAPLPPTLTPLPGSVLPAPITNVRWLATGLAVAAADHLFFYSSKLDAGHQDAHRLAASLCAPLPLHHPQLLFQALLQGSSRLAQRLESAANARLLRRPLRRRRQSARWPRSRAHDGRTPHARADEGGRAEAYARRLPSKPASQYQGSSGSLHV